MGSKTADATKTRIGHFEAQQYTRRGVGEEGKWEESIGERGEKGNGYAKQARGQSSTGILTCTPM